MGRVDVEWTVADPGIATIGADGKAVGVAPGVTTVTASLGGLAATATVEVHVSEVPGAAEPGVSYFGRNGYVEYIPGTLPLILSAPHGGGVRPSEIPDRTEGEFTSDVATIALTLAVRDAFVAATGSAPHVVISHLHRARFDANRELEEAAGGNPFAENAFHEYHGFIEQARRTVATRGEGLYLDMHGHGHDLDRLELGYLLTAGQLDLPDYVLSALTVVQQTSIRELGRDSPLPFAELLRGDLSLGGFLGAQGLRSVPSPSDPSPGEAPYFSGGYSTRRHGSIADTELVSGIQIEHHWRGVRDSEQNRAAYAARLVEAVRAFMLEHVGYFEP